jgi:DNA-binding Lrp family transcriptional regulator
MQDLDSIDQGLLERLQANSRASTSALARELNISRSTVQDRIHRLERKKIIAGYTIRFHDNFSGRLLNAHVMIQINPKQSQQIVDALSRISAVRTVHTVSGIYDLMTTVQTSTTQEMDAILDQIGDLRGVEKTTTSIVLATKLER